MKYTNLLLMTAVLFGCQPQKSNETNGDEPMNSAPSVSLTKVWETDTTLITPESVILDQVTGTIFVSCIGAVPPEAEDGDGYISKISSTDGSIIDLKFVDGLDGPKGLGLKGNKLYVSDITKLIEIDTETGEITNTVVIDSAQFLNDVDVDANGTVYVTDSWTNTVYTVKDGVASVWFQDDGIGGVNGVMVNGNTAMLAGFQSGQLWSVDIDNPSLSLVADSMFNADGIEKIGDDYLISCWSGQAYYASANGSVQKILDTEEIGERAADIDFISDKNWMIVPTFFANKVVAYEVVVK